MAYPRAHDVASQATNSIKVSEGRRPEHLVNNTWSVFKLHLRIYGITNRIESYKENIDWQSVIPVYSRLQGVVLRPRVFRETITVIPLWRHNSGPWNNGESITAHGNAIPRTMGFITI